ncbi:hypothetical protein [Treponema sp.]|uniref:hypothetical protein n=1 Tax=Treponema sp. TaxID=166 RepID=UPI00257B836D|nr:hypothetical protein [Treponema sp.]MBE6354407.1 hypothetical protein [Treponema sp.]
MFFFRFSAALKKILIPAAALVLAVHPAAQVPGTFVEAEPLFEEPAKISENTVPLLLKGIWSNKNRYVVFDTGYLSAPDSSVPQIVLKVFYGLYDDRAQESSEYTQSHERDVNDVTPQAKAQENSVTYHPLTQQLFPREYGLDVINENGNIYSAGTASSGAWDLEIKYEGYGDKYHVPVCVIGDNIYLDFVIKTYSPEDESNPVLGFWQDAGSASGILISPPVLKKELVSYFVTENAVYHIRYWRTDMEYEPSVLAVFSDGNETYSVPKHLLSGGKVYTCVNGRGTKIRNIEKSQDFPFEYTLNSVKITRESDDGGEESFTTSTLCAFGKPYLTRTDGTMTLEQILEKDASRPPLPRKPLFPPHGILDFDWSIIEDPPSDWNRRMQDLGK